LLFLGVLALLDDGLASEAESETPPLAAVRIDQQVQSGAIR
jgi:hypothetical protein